MLKGPTANIVMPQKEADPRSQQYQQIQPAPQHYQGQPQYQPASQYYQAQPGYQPQYQPASQPYQTQFAPQPAYNQQQAYQPATYQQPTQAAETVANKFALALKRHRIMNSASNLDSQWNERADEFCGKINTIAKIKPPLSNDDAKLMADFAVIMGVIGSGITQDKLANPLFKQLHEKFMNYFGQPVVQLQVNPQQVTAQQSQFLQQPYQPTQQYCQAQLQPASYQQATQPQVNQHQQMQMQQQKQLLEDDEKRRRAEKERIQALQAARAPMISWVGQHFEYIEYTPDGKESKTAYTPGDGSCLMHALYRGALGLTNVKEEDANNYIYKKGAIELRRRAMANIVHCPKFMNSLFTQIEDFRKYYIGMASGASASAVINYSSSVEIIIGNNLVSPKTDEARASLERLVSQELLEQDIKVWKEKITQWWMEQHINTAVYSGTLEMELLGEITGPFLVKNNNNNDSWKAYERPNKAQRHEDLKQLEKTPENKAILANLKEFSRGFSKRHNTQYVELNDIDTLMINKEAELKAAQTPQPKNISTHIADYGNDKDKYSIALVKEMHNCLNDKIDDNNRSAIEIYTEEYQNTSGGFKLEHNFSARENARQKHKKDFGDNAALLASVDLEWLRAAVKYECKAKYDQTFDNNAFLQIRVKNYGQKTTQHSQQCLDAINLVKQTPAKYKNLDELAGGVKDDAEAKKIIALAEPMYLAQKSHMFAVAALQRYNQPGLNSTDQMQLIGYLQDAVNKLSDQCLGDLDNTKVITQLNNAITLIKEQENQLRQNVQMQQQPQQAPQQQQEAAFITALKRYGIIGADNNDTSDWDYKLKYLLMASYDNVATIEQQQDAKVIIAALNPQGLTFDANTAHYRYQQKIQQINQQWRQGCQPDSDTANSAIALLRDVRLGYLAWAQLESPPQSNQQQIEQAIDTFCNNNPGRIGELNKALQAALTVNAQLVQNQNVIQTAQNRIKLFNTQEQSAELDGVGKKNNIEKQLTPEEYLKYNRSVEYNSAAGGKLTIKDEISRDLVKRIQDAKETHGKIDALKQLISTLDSNDKYSRKPNSPRVENDDKERAKSITEACQKLEIEYGQEGEKIVQGILKLATHEGLWRTKGSLGATASIHALVNVLLAKGSSDTIQSMNELKTSMVTAPLASSIKKHQQVVNEDIRTPKMI